MTHADKIKRSLRPLNCRWCGRRFKPTSGRALSCSRCVHGTRKCACGCGESVQPVGCSGARPLRYVHGHNSRGVSHSGSGFKYWSRLSTAKKQARAAKISATIKAQYASGKKLPYYKNSSGGWTLTRKGGQFYFKSSWELTFAQLLDSAGMVAKFKYEPFRIPYTYYGKQHMYFPDFWIKLKDGREFVIELKGVVTAKDRSKFRAAVQWCTARGMDFAPCFQCIDSLPALTTLIQ